MSKYPELDQKGKKAVEHFKKEVGKLRTGRASAGLVDSITVDYYGSQVPILQVGLINTPEPRLITIQVFDGSAVEAVEKAIMQADLGLTPSRDGNLIRLNIPALTEERRKDLVKKLHKMGEEAKIEMRNHRRDAIDELKKQEKNKAISADDLRRGQDEIQKVIDAFIADLDTVVAGKEKEIQEI